MSQEEYLERAKRHTFKPAPEGASTDERIAVALEFIAREVGDAAHSLDHLNTQMDTLITSVDWITPTASANAETGS